MKTEREGEQERRSKKWTNYRLSSWWVTDKDLNTSVTKISLFNFSPQSHVNGATDVVYNESPLCMLKSVAAWGRFLWTTRHRSFVLVDVLAVESRNIHKIVLNNDTYITSRPENRVLVTVLRWRPPQMVSIHLHFCLRALQMHKDVRLILHQASSRGETVAKTSAAMQKMWKTLHGRCVLAVDIQSAAWKTSCQTKHQLYVQSFCSWVPGSSSSADQPAESDAANRLNVFSYCW